MLDRTPRTNPKAVVSIHARQYWRAMRALPARPLHRSRRFNPRPPILAGDAHRSRFLRVMPCMFQSTPANTGGRCADRDWHLIPNERFQSTPANTGGRCIRKSMRVPQFLPFQSTPANTGGRCGGGRRTWHTCARCFNPRPPILAGDALRTQHTVHAHIFPSSTRTLSF